MEVKIYNDSINPLPEYAKFGDAGMDLMADFSKGVNEKFLFDGAYFNKNHNCLVMPPQSRALIPTNIYTSFPIGYEAQIRPRSGLALKNGIEVVNSPGTIDCGYRNSWGIILKNGGSLPFIIEQGDRIAQAVFTKVEVATLAQVSEQYELEKSDRGLGGFGHTGGTK